MFILESNVEIEKSPQLDVDVLDQVLNNLNNGESLELVAEDLKIARGFLDELVGRKFSDSLLGDIFNNYCIGK